MLIAAGIFGLSASSQWDEAKAVCGGSTTCATEADAARANELGAEARSTGNIATVLTIVGAVSVTTAIVLWATAPKKERAVRVGAAPTADGFAVSIGGRF